MSVFVYDPILQDTLSKVRGVGRYLQLLHLTFGNEFQFIARISAVPRDATFINPFFNFLQPPLHVTRVAKKQIAVIHDLIPLKYPAHFPIGLKGQLNVFLNKLSLKTYDRIVTDSEVSKNDVVKILSINPEKIQVIYPALPQVFFNASFDHRSSIIESRKSNIKDRDYFIYVGDATWNKNLVNIARAVQKADVVCMFVGKIFADSPFTVHGSQKDNNVILGTPSVNRGTPESLVDSGQARMTNALNLSHPWQQELKQFMELTKDDQRFIFPGYVSDEELTFLYKNAVANILISRDEGFGFSYFEAASQKTPSILADRPIFHETAQDTALFVDPENPDTIATSLKTLLTDRTMRVTLGEKSYERAKNFTLQSFQKKWTMVFNQI